MEIAWRALHQQIPERLKRCLKSEWLKAAWLIIVVLFAVHSGVIRPLNAFRGIAMEFWEYASKASKRMEGNPFRSAPVVRTKDARGGLNGALEL